MPRRPLFAALAVALVLPLASATLPTPAAGAPEQQAATSAAAVAAADEVLLPHDDPFYRYRGDEPLGRIAPGTVLKHRTVPVTLFGQGDSPVTAEQLLYRTQDQQRRPTVTVTTVLQPLTPPTGLVTYLSFYDALGDQCSPSYTLRGGDAGTDANNQQAQIEEGLVLALLAQGYAVTVPDFEGLDLHWVAGQESGWNTLDSIRATQAHLGMDPAATKVGLFGYSGGSIGGEWAAELAPRYAPELDLVGAALGGLPVHLAHNLHYINGSETWSGVIPAVLVSLGRAFGLPVGRYRSAYGAKVMRQVHDQCIGSFNGSYPGLRVDDLLKKRYEPFLRTPAIARVVNRLIMGSTPGHPQTPLLLGVGDHDGTGDDVMVVDDVAALGRQYCRQGVAVRFQRYARSDHTTAGIQFFPQAMTWLAARFAGVPVTGNCDRIPKGGSLKPLPIRRHR